MSDVRRVVVLTGQADLRDAVVRLVALAGAHAEVLGASGGLRGVWPAADVVVIGADLAATVLAAGLPRRPGVCVVTTREPDSSLWRSAVEIGAARLLVLPADERLFVELIGEAVEVAPASSSVIAVIGGCGGAGASTFAAALALVSSRQSPTLLVDTDRLGGGLDVLLGAEQRPGARWPDLAGTRGRLSSQALADAVVALDGIGLLSWDRSGAPPVEPEAFAEVFDAALRGYGHVVVDLARSLDPCGEVAVAAAELIVMIVPARVRPAAAAATLATDLSARGGRLGLVVRDAGPSRLSVENVVGAIGLPVIASLHSDTAVVVAAERGVPPLRRLRGSLADACQSVLAFTSGARIAA